MNNTIFFPDQPTTNQVTDQPPSVPEPETVVPQESVAPAPDTRQDPAFVIPATDSQNSNPFIPQVTPDAASQYAGGYDGGQSGNSFFKRLPIFIILAMLS